MDFQQIDITGCRLRASRAALVGGRAAGICTALDGCAAEEQIMSKRWSAVVLQGAQQRIGVLLVAAAGEIATRIAAEIVAAGI